MGRSMPKSVSGLAKIRKQLAASSHYLSPRSSRNREFGESALLTHADSLQALNGRTLN